MTWALGTGHWAGVEKSPENTSALEATESLSLYSLQNTGCWGQMIAHHTGGQGGLSASELVKQQAPGRASSSPLAG